MFVETKRGDVLPEGAVKVSEEEALNLQKKFIKNWPSVTDVFFLRYGKYMNGVTTGFSSYLIFRYLMQKLNLKISGRSWLTFVPTVLAPVGFSYLATDSLLTDKILLMKMDCPLCHQAVFAAGQLYLSIIFPSSYGYFTLGALASECRTYPLPSIVTHAKEFWRETFKVLKGGALTFQVAGIIQIFTVLMLPYMQNKELINVTNKARESALYEEIDPKLNIENPL